jgi:peptidyl-prolyl cis-trans isomerase SurA
MKSHCICAILLISSTLLPAQMASHAPANKSSLPPAQLTTVQVTGKVVAKVNNTALTDKDLLREMYAIFPYGKQHNGFPKAQEAQIRQGALQMIIFEELVYQEALRRKMAIPAAQIDRGEAAYRQQFESPEQFQQYMQTEMHGSRQAFRQQIERSMLIDQLLKQEVDQKSAVTAADLQAYYEKNAAHFEVPDSYTFQAISIVPPPNSSPDQLKDAGKRAEAALKQAKATHGYQDFGLLAEKISEDDYRVNMGDHKVVPGEKLPPQVIAAFKGMKSGEVSGLIQIETAYTIVRLNAHTPAHKQSLAEVKSGLKVELQKEKSEQLRMGFDKRLRAKAKIELS